MPGQPSSTSSPHSASPYVARLGGLAHLRPRRARGEQLARDGLDLLLVLGQVEVHCRAPLSGLGQAEHALGDDVLEHLGGAALDRVAARAQQLVGPRAAGLERLRAEQVGRELGELLVGVGPHPLGQRALGPGLAVLLDRGQPAVGGQAQHLRAQVQVAEPVGDERVVEQPAAGGLRDQLVEQLAQAHLERRSRGRRARSSASSARPSSRCRRRRARSRPGSARRR